MPKSYDVLIVSGSNAGPYSILYSDALGGSGYATMKKNANTAQNLSYKTLAYDFGVSVSVPLEANTIKVFNQNASSNAVINTFSLNNPTPTLNTPTVGCVNYNGTGYIGISATGGSGNYKYHIGLTDPSIAPLNPSNFNNSSYRSSLPNSYYYYVGVFDQVYYTYAVQVVELICPEAPSLSPTPTPTITVTPTISITPTITVTPTVTPSKTPTVTPTPSTQMYKYFFQMVTANGSLTLNATGGNQVITTNYSLILAGQNTYNLQQSTINANAGYYISKIERYVPYDVNPTTTITLGSSYTSYTLPPFSMSSGGIQVNEFETIKVYFGIVPSPSPTSTPTPTPTITPTPSKQYATVYLNPLNGLDTNSYLIVINGVSDASFKSGYRSYEKGTTIAVTYNNPPACNVTLNGSTYNSGDILTLVTTSNQTFILRNANNYTVSGGGFCSACVSYLNTTNDCGQTSSTPGGNYCNTSPSYTNNVGTMYVCYGGGYNSYAVYQNTNPCFVDNQYFSNGVSYGSNPSNSVNSSANWVSNGASYCTGCNQYQPQIDNNTCSSTYNTTRNALIGSNTTACGGCCGQSTAANWTDQGYSTCSSCVSYTVFKDTNTCSSTYNHYRVNGVDVGTSQPSGTACNTAANWTNTGTQCVGYTKYDVQTDNNPCSSTYNTTRLRNAVPNSPSCGYVAATTFNIFNYNGFDTVSGTYTDKFGNGQSFSFTDYSGYSGTIGTICAISGTVNVTSGNGGASDTYNMC
jgi:hypothetical protein